MLSSLVLKRVTTVMAHFSDCRNHYFMARGQVSLESACQSTHTQANHKGT